MKMISTVSSSHFFLIYIVDLFLLRQQLDVWFFKENSEVFLKNIEEFLQNNFEIGMASLFKTEVGLNKSEK